MFRPAHPRVMNFRPRLNSPQNNFQWRPNKEPRAFYDRNHCFRPKPPHLQEKGNQDHWCETCDRGFPSVTLLEDHKSQHQKCNIDGCQFVAHPKVITRHIQMQHSTGLYKKIAKLDNPEEVQKWREERKKNFPTRSNIVKKAAQVKEKMDRGEKMGLKQGPRFRDTKTGNKRKFDSNNKNYNNTINFKKKKIMSGNKVLDSKMKPENSKNTLKYLPPVENSRQLLSFNGIQQLIMDMEDNEDEKEPNIDFLIEDEGHIEKNAQETSKTNEPVLCGALVSLMCQYGSSDEDEEQKSGISQFPQNSKAVCTSQKHAEETQSIQNEANVENKDVLNSHNIVNNDDNDSGPEETEIKKNVEEESIISGKKEIPRSTKKKQHDKKYIKHTYNRKHKVKPPSTLLQKLLSKEIRHERNLILQCVRYVVQNNFFDK